MIGALGISPKPPSRIQPERSCPGRRRAALPLRTIAAMLTALPLVTGCGEPNANVPRRSINLASDAYTVDQIYRSMIGPKSTVSIAIEETEEPELLWITGYSTSIVDAVSGEPRSAEFMCHNNLNLQDTFEHRRLFGREGVTLAGRLFTLSQGQMEVEFPQGFGIPVLSTERFRLETQVLNLNEQEEELQVRHETVLNYVRDRELDTPMKALYQKGVQGLVLLKGKDGYFGVLNGSSEEHGEGCAIGMEAANNRPVPDRFGRSFSAHWVVEPGREERRTLVTSMLDIMSDTTVHHIAVHLHPFAESLELLDLTAEQTVYKSNATNRVDGIGLEAVEYYSSVEGIELHADHQYELVSTYNNTSGVEQDSMAVMFLYMLDDKFENPLTN